MVLVLADESLEVLLLPLPCPSLTSVEDQALMLLVERQDVLLPENCCTLKADEVPLISVSGTWILSAYKPPGMLTCGQIKDLASIPTVVLIN